MTPNATAILHNIIVEEDSLHKNNGGKVPTTVTIQPHKKHAYILRLIKANYNVSYVELVTIINTIIAAK